MDLRKRCVNCIPPIRTRLQDCGEHLNPPSFPPAVALSVSIPLQPFPSCPSCPRTFLSLPRWGKTACRLVALLHPLKPVPVWAGLACETSASRHQKGSFRATFPLWVPKTRSGGVISGVGASGCPIYRAVPLQTLNVSSRDKEGLSAPSNLS